MDRVMSQRNGSLITGQPEHKVLRQVKILHLQYSWSDRHRRKAAEMEMEQMGHDALPSLISLMGVASKPNVGSRRAGFLVWTLFATMVTTMCVGSAAASGSWREVIASILFCGTLFGFMWTLSLWANKSAQLTMSELQLLIRVSDRRSIPTLIDLHAHLLDIDQQWQIRKRITELLPVLDATDSQNFPSLYAYRLVRSINGSWNETSDVQFAVAALNACGQLGDDRSVPFVRALARSGQNDRIRTAARECVPLLLARRQRLRTGNGLLRAAGNDAAPEVLLRACAPGRTAALELLRGHTGGPGLEP